MKFEQILPHYRNGESIRCKHWNNKDYYVNINSENKLNTNLEEYELLSDDWEIHKEPEIPILLTKSQVVHAFVNTLKNTNYSRYAVNGVVPVLESDLPALLKELGF